MHLHYFIYYYFGSVFSVLHLYRFATDLYGPLVLGEMQRIAFRLMLSSCVCVLCVCVCVPRLWTSGKQYKIETPFFF